MPRWLKGIVAIILLGILLMGVEWSRLPGRLFQFSLIVVTVALVSIAGQFLASAWKWRCSLQLHDVQLPFGFVLKVLCIGYFFNNFLPSAIGGDAYRVFRTMPLVNNRLHAVSAVVIDRAVGLAVMLALGFLAALTLINANTFAQTYLALTGVGLVIGAATVGAAYLGWFKFASVRLRKFGWFHAIEHSAQRVLRLRRDWIGFLTASAMFQILAAVILHALFNGAGVDFNMAECMLVAVASGLASVVPVSINGIGVVEGTIAGTAVAMGAEYEAALLVAVALRILVLPANALCGLIYLFDRRNMPAIVVTSQEY